MASEMLSNRYILVKPVGSGGMADVYLAIDSILKREVAVKILRGDLAEDPANLARFKKEAAAISNTSHPNIVEIYDVGEDNGRYYIVMEFIHGRTLKQLIRQRGSIPIDETVNIMKQLTSAVAHAHKVGIIHRDIKTQNVLVKDDGTVKLSDFGIAYTGDATQLTQAETVMGSVHYLAPELANGEMCTPQSDIYSLGIVFYEMLTGSVPFKGETPVEIALKHLHDEIPSVIEYNAQIPQSVENIVIRATAKKKEQRYKSANEMFADISTCLDLKRSNENRLEIREKPLRESTSSRKVKKGGKGFDFSAALFIVLAITLALAIVLMMRSLSGEVEQKQVQVPNIISYQLADGKEALTQMGLNVDTIIYESSDTIEKGRIISVSPSVGSTVDEGTYVSITVSEGLNYTFKNLLGKTLEEATQELNSNDFYLITVNEVVTTDASRIGRVVSQSVEEGKVFKPSDIRGDVTLGIGVYQKVQIPMDIVGKDIDEAKAQLEELGFTVTLVQGEIENNLNDRGEYIIPLHTVFACDPIEGSEFTMDGSDHQVTLSYY